MRKISEKVKLTNTAQKDIAELIINKIWNQAGYREKEIIKNLTEVERNTEVPEGYIQYRFYDNNGNGFQAGKYKNGSYGISE